MVNTFSDWKFGSGILDYLSRNPVFSGNFPFGKTKIGLPFTFQPKFPDFCGKWKTTCIKVCRAPYNDYPACTVLPKGSLPNRDILHRACLKFMRILPFWTFRQKIQK